MLKFIALVCIAMVAGCASERQFGGQESDPQAEMIQRQQRLSEAQAQFRQAQPQTLDADKPITITVLRDDPFVIQEFKRVHPGESFMVIGAQPEQNGTELSYNPELRRMGMRIGSDGQPKRIAGDGEIPATWEDLRRAQGFGR